MAHLAAHLAFPLGGDAGSFFPSGTLLGPPFGTDNSAYGPNFNPNYPPGALPYANYPQGALNFFRWMPTPLVDGSTVVDLVMPGGYNTDAQWYVVLYTYAGG